MNMTLFVDASFCDRTNAAGWGAWVKRDGWHSGAVFGGEIVSVLNASEAELVGIGKALEALAVRDQLEGLFHIMIQSDCLRALSLIASQVDNALPAKRARDNGKRVLINTKLTASPVEQKALETIRSATRDVPIYVRHVKGHSKGSTRSWVNAQCDRLARQYMKIGRQRRQYSGPLSNR